MTGRSRRWARLSASPVSAVSAEMSGAITNDTCRALDQGHIRQVQSADLVDALGDLTEPLADIESGLPPQAGIDGSRAGSGQEAVGCSPHTIASYRDTFKLLIAWFRDNRSVPPERLTLDRIDADAVTGFLNWLETERHNSISTRNQRLAAVSSFFRWLQSQDPARMACCQTILAVPAKRDAQPRVNHPTVEQTRSLLAAPDRATRRGRRDATLLATLYDTAARVSEFADLTVRDIRLAPPPLVVLTGKGRKTRHVPIGDNTAALLNAYLTEHGLDRPGHDDHPLFTNQHHRKLSRGGVAWILTKY